MDDDDFFNFAKDFKREIISIGYVKGRVKTDDSMVRKETKKEILGREYADDYQHEEAKTMLKVNIIIYNSLLYSTFYFCRIQC